MGWGGYFEKRNIRARRGMIYRISIQNSKFPSTRKKINIHTGVTFLNKKDLPPIIWQWRVIPIYSIYIPYFYGENE